MITKTINTTKHEDYRVKDDYGNVKKQKFEVGECVFACKHGSPFFFPGKVLRKEGDSYFIKFFTLEKMEKSVFLINTQNIQCFTVKRAKAILEDEQQDYRTKQKVYIGLMEYTLKKNKEKGTVDRRNCCCLCGYREWDLRCYDCGGTYHYSCALLSEDDFSTLKKRDRLFSCLRCNYRSLKAMKKPKKVNPLQGLEKRDADKIVNVRAINYSENLSKKKYWGNGFDRRKKLEFKIFKNSTLRNKSTRDSRVSRYSGITNDMLRKLNKRSPKFRTKKSEIQNDLRLINSDSQKEIDTLLQFTDTSFIRKNVFPVIRQFQEINESRFIPRNVLRITLRYRTENDLVSNIITIKSPQMEKITNNQIISILKMDGVDVDNIKELRVFDDVLNGWTKLKDEEYHDFSTEELKKNHVLVNVLLKF